MSNWISLSNLSSRTDVVETTLHGHTIFEVPVGRKTRFTLDIDRLRILQSKRHMMYFVYQDIEDFGEESWGGWTSGPAATTLHEYFNKLDGGKQNYTAARVKQIGNNYITAFVIGGDGRVNWSNNTHISYSPTKEGKGIWLEALYYSPDWNNMGVFIIGVDQPQIVSLFAKKREAFKFNPDENFISVNVDKVGGLKYGDTLDLHIKTHRVIPGRYSAEVEILYQGTRVYNGKKRLELDKYAMPNNPALEYNLEMIENLSIDPAWEDAIGHPPGTIQKYTFRLTIEPKNAPVTQTELGDGQVITKEFEFEVNTNLFDFKFPILGTNPQIIAIQEETLTPIEHEECRYSALEITVDKQPTQVILKENVEQGVLETNLINPEIHVVAGNNGDKKVTIQLTDVVTEECGDTPSHTDNVFVYNDVVGQWEPEKTKTKLVLKPKYEYSWPATNGFALSYLWLRDSLALNNNLTIQTCRYRRNVGFKVYPDVEWELAFLITIGSAITGKMKYSRERLNGYHRGYGFNLLKEELNVDVQKDKVIGWDIVGKCKLSGREHEISLNPIKKTIGTTVSAYNVVCDYLEIFNPKDAKRPSAAKAKGILDIEFAIDPPNIGFALGSKFDYASNQKVVPVYTGGLKVDPLIGISIGVDLVPIIGKIPTVGAIVDWIVRVVEWVSDSDVYLVFEVFSAIKGELSLSYNKVDGFTNIGQQKVELEAGVALKAGIKSNDTVFITTVDKDGIIETQEVEEWKAEGKVKTSFSFIEEVGFDNGGQYKQSSVWWNGAVLTITCYKLISKREINYNPKYTETFTLFERNNILEGTKQYLKDE